LEGLPLKLCKKSFFVKVGGNLQMGKIGRRVLQIDEAKFVTKFERIEQDLYENLMRNNNFDADKLKYWDTAEDGLSIYEFDGKEEELEKLAYVKGGYNFFISKNTNDNGEIFYTLKCDDDILGRPIEIAIFYIELSSNLNEFITEYNGINQNTADNILNAKNEEDTCTNSFEFSYCDQNTNDAEIENESKN
jgi:hypothetical protein